MKLKRFVAQDTKKALQMIKESLGNDAVILSSHSVEEGVEVVAAVDYDESVINQKAAVAEVTLHQKDKQEVSPLDDMKQEIQTLRDMIECQISTPSNNQPPLHRLLVRRLMSLGMDETQTYQYITSINPNLTVEQAWYEVLKMFQKDIPIYAESPIESGGWYAFMGPTGVGKTTTIAKIAARFALRYGAEHLGLVTMDSYRIAAHEQLMTYGKILGISISLAEDEAALTRVMRKLSSKKLVLVDTAGMNPNDFRVISQLNALDSHAMTIRKVLVLSATSHYQVVKNAISCYQEHGIDQCILTKIDEAMGMAGALSACIQKKIPISYFTIGQRVPEDIKLASVNALLECLIEDDKRINDVIKLESKDDLLRSRAYVQE